MLNTTVVEKVIRPFATKFLDHLKIKAGERPVEVTEEAVINECATLVTGILPLQSLAETDAALSRLQREVGGQFSRGPLLFSKLFDPTFCQTIIPHLEAVPTGRSEKKEMESDPIKCGNLIGRFWVNNAACESTLQLGVTFTLLSVPPEEVHLLRFQSISLPNGIEGQPIPGVSVAFQISKEFSLIDDGSIHCSVEFQASVLERSNQLLSADILLEEQETNRAGVLCAGMNWMGHGFHEDRENVTPHLFNIASGVIRSIAAQVVPQIHGALMLQDAVIT